MLPTNINLTRASGEKYQKFENIFLIYSPEKKKCVIPTCLNASENKLKRSHQRLFFLNIRAAKKKLAKN
ncbi:hypothetical protein BpHYR1_009230 [Brachionus plicatilis]|uniref:Uncharacterized protein n=1 Tax=Brachionus plicatilis TaxID=10195 RepID=A0A3M7Q2F4_BRAPC|nr:hypothetical protein BpHYR1_009230 [Brachionus plicatilis]